jgi:hypothetical protein
MAETAKTQLEKMNEDAPQLMAELTEEFIKKPDLESRIKTRLRIKALLDMLAVDTTYPKVPDEAKSKDGDGERPVDAVEGLQVPRPGLPGGIGNYIQTEDMTGGRRRSTALPQSVAAVPGAEEAQNNEIVLG